MNPQQLENNLAFIEQKFGMDWLKELVEKYKELDPERTTTGRYINLWNVDISPVALMWLRCREQLAFYYLNGQLEASPEVLLLLRLVDNIKTVENSAGFSERFESLKDESQYRIAAYEINIAAGFVNMGKTVSFTHDPGVFLVHEGNFKVACIIQDSAGDGEFINYLRVLDLLTGKEGYGTRLFYLDFELQPGEQPAEGLKHRARILGERIKSFDLDNIVFTTTVFGRENGGYFLMEKCYLLKEYKDLDIFLPDTKRR